MVLRLSGVGVLVAHASMVLEAPPEEVWAALVGPESLAGFIPVAEISVDWREGGSLATLGFEAKSLWDFFNCVS